MELILEENVVHTCNIFSIFCIDTPCCKATTIHQNHKSKRIQVLLGHFYYLVF